MLSKKSLPRVEKESDNYVIVLIKSLKSNKKLPGGVGRRHMVLKCLGVVLQSSPEVDREFPAEDPLEFWDDG